MDFLSDAYFSVMNKTLDGLWARNEVISHNIANFETPNYKRKTIDFETSLQKAINEVSDNNQFVWNHHQGKEKREGQILAPEGKPGEGKGRQHRHHQHDSGGTQCEDDSIYKILDKRHLGKGAHIVFKSRRKGIQLRNISRIVGGIAFE